MVVRYPVDGGGAVDVLEVPFRDDLIPKLGQRDSGQGLFHLDLDSRHSLDADKTPVEPVTSRQGDGHHLTFFIQDLDEVLRVVHLLLVFDVAHSPGSHGSLLKREGGAGFRAGDNHPG